MFIRKLRSRPQMRAICNFRTSCVVCSPRFVAKNVASSPPPPVGTDTDAPDARSGGCRSPGAEVRERTLDCARQRQRAQGDFDTEPVRPKSRRFLFFTR